MISYKTVINGWNDFFFAPKSTDSIALFRILWCSLLLVYFLFDSQNIQTIYGQTGLISLETVKVHFPYPHLNLFNIFGNSDNFLYLFFSIYGLAIISALLGFCTRPALIIVLCCMVTLHQRGIWMMSSSETLMRIITILLVVSPCGHSLSLDAKVAEKFPAYRKEKDWAPWAMRLIQIQLSVVYLWTVWQKFKGETWLDGTALYYATRIESFKNFPVPFILDNLAVIKLLTWSTLIIEAGLGLLVWIKEFRIPVIILGIAFHLGIEYTMSIPFFEWVMMVLLMIHITPEEVQILKSKVGEKWVLVTRSRSLGVIPPA